MPHQSTNDPFQVHGLAVGTEQASRTRRNGHVVTTHVIESAWAAALTLAGNDPKRLYVIDATTVLVLNRPMQRVDWS